MATGRIGVTPTLGTRWSKAPAGGTTSLSGLDDNSVSLVYSVGYEQVYRNGVLLSRGNDYTATTGNSITLIDATIAGDIIEVFANELVPLTDAISKGQFTAKGALLSATAASTPAVLTVGSNNQVLTADSSTATGLKWATPSAGGMTQLATGSIASAVTGIDISSIPSTYYELLLFIDGASIAAGTEVIGIRFNNDSGSNYSGTYIEPGGSAAIGSQAVTFFRISGGMNHTLLTQGGYVRVTNYANTTGWKTITSQCVQSSDVVINAFGMWKDTSAINRIQLITNGSTFDAGVYTLYGVK